MKYLVIMTCAQEGYWDTSGYCHWKKEAVFRESEFDLDDEEGLTKAIGHFKFQNPNGDVSIYKIEKADWGSEDPFYQKTLELLDKSEDKALQYKIADDLAQKEKAKAKRLAEDEQAKAYELEQLRKLQEKYKGEI